MFFASMSRMFPYEEVMLSGRVIADVSMGAGTNDSKSDMTGGPETTISGPPWFPRQRNGTRVISLPGSVASCIPAYPGGGWFANTPKSPPKDMTTLQEEKENIENMASVMFQPMRNSVSEYDKFLSEC